MHSSSVRVLVYPCFQDELAVLFHCKHWGACHDKARRWLLLWVEADQVERAGHGAEHFKHLCMTR